MAYPKLKRFYLKSDLEEHFKITHAELQFINENRPKKDKNLLGFLVFFKCYLFLGYPPQQKRQIGKKLVEWIAAQAGLNPSAFAAYEWKVRVWKRHLAVIRKYSGFRTPKSKDTQALKQYLISHTVDLESDEDLLLTAAKRCKATHLELPSEKELVRLVNSARHAFLQKICQKNCPSNKS